VRLRIRPRSRGETGIDGEPRSREAPASLLTTWLRQGLRDGMCPLCPVMHKADREYIWHFYDEGADQGESIDELRRSCGFCAEHTEMLRKIDMEAMKSTLAITTMFADVLAGICKDLESLGPAAAFERAACPACVNRDRLVHANARYLLDELASSPGYRETFASSPGLCFAHFQLTWSVALSRADRELILDVQRTATHSLLADLREHIRKQDDRFRHEPVGPEADSWARAIQLTAGWPAPSTSAAKPE
jgi:hypothetical protein